MTKIAIIYPNNKFCLNCARSIHDTGYAPFCSSKCSQRAYRLESEKENMDLALLCIDCGNQRKLKDDNRNVCADCAAKE